MIDKETLCVPLSIKKIIKSEELINEYKEKSKQLVDKYEEGWGYDWAHFCSSWNSGLITKDIIYSTSLFKEIQKPILDALQEYIEEMNLSSDYNLTITDSWLNATREYGFQESHEHEPCTVSGCFYISSPKVYGPFYISNPFTYTLHKEMPVFANKKYIELEEGDLILFPSNLLHGVMQNPMNENRYSIAFNAMAHEKNV